MVEGLILPFDPVALAAEIRHRVGSAHRFIVAIAGPPGAGKSTIVEPLCRRLIADGIATAIVPMDGFHYDDAVLGERGWLSRKGAPYTFDFGGLRSLLQRLRVREDAVAIPVFDRNLEIARAGAAMVSADTRIILVEGNYLLLEEQPWSDLAQYFSLTVFLQVPDDELEKRLTDRWLALGFDVTEANTKARDNDLPNARLVTEKSRPADIVLR